MLRRAVSGLLAILFLASAGAAEEAAPASRQAGALLLDETAYCRIHYQFGMDRISAPVLKADGEKLLGEPGLRRLERTVKGLLKERRLDWAREDWRDHAVMAFYLSNESGGGGTDPYRGRYVHTGPPPADWMRPEFDDGDWPRLRQPHLVGQEAAPGWQDVSYLGVRRICYRTRFRLGEPAEPGGLTLHLVYRGGARVFVNGHEIARRHLGKDTPGSETLADEYPLDAYAKRGEEVLPIEKQWDEQRRARKRAVAKYKFVPELPGRFEQGAALKGKEVGRPEVTGNVPDLRRFGWRATALLTRAAFGRVNGARDRTCEATIPARLLRSGSNVLAVEIVAAPLHPVTVSDWMGGLRGNFGWRHAYVKRLELRSSQAGTPSALARPPGVQVWTEDIHRRVWSTDFSPGSASPGTVRIVAARNGTFSGQIVVGTEKELRGLKATAGALTHAGGKGALSASAVGVSYLIGRPANELASLDGARAAGASRELTEEEKRLNLRFFDQLSAAAPRAVPAGTCQPLWLSLRVPADAAAGVYRGSVRVEADGMAAVSVPVEVDVVDWRVPDAGEFQTVVGMEQSPYGVARQYGVQAWSDEHFRLMESTFRLLGRAGNDWWFVPVLQYTEFGNRQDSPIKWIRRKDGSLAFDYTTMDRYLDLAIKHCGRPRVISFVVMHGNPANPPQVALVDEQTGQSETLKLGRDDLPEARRREVWSRFATSLLAHMAARGLADVTYWGFAWDTEGDAALKYLLAEFAPGVYWTASGHTLRVDPAYYRATEQIYGRYTLTPRTQRGWKQPTIHLLNPRGGGNTHCTSGSALPFSWRLLPSRAIAGGYRGVGRIGADYWKGAYYDGAKGGVVYLQPGMPVHVTFWPAPDGADSSVRFEVMLEGIQEAEARIFLEQALDRGLLPEDVAGRVGQVLLAHNRETLYVSINANTGLDAYAHGWQDRSGRLFSAAAEVGRLLGMDVEAPAITAEVAPRSTPTITLKLRNWTAGPRPWKVAASERWILPEKNEGSLTGFESLAVRLDGNALRPETTATGTLTVTDAASGRAYPVKITAKVGAVFEFVAGSPVLNISVGGKVSRRFALVNRSGRELRWRSDSSVPWLELAPAGGALPAGRTAILKLTCLGQAPAGGPHKSTLTIKEEGGDAAQTVHLRTFVIPPYRRPAALPEGPPVYLEDVQRERIRRHGIILSAEKDPDSRIDPMWGHQMMCARRDQNQAKRISFGGGGGSDVGITARLPKEKNYQHGMWVRPHHETAFDLAGSGFTGFSAEVGLPAGMARSGSRGPVNFEIHVDGKVRAQSGMMRVGDEPRLLVVDGLAGAKQLKLLTRLDDLKNDYCVIAFWAEAKFHKAK